MAPQQSWRHDAQASCLLSGRETLSGSYALTYLRVWGIGRGGCRKDGAHCTIPELGKR